MKKSQLKQIIKEVITSRIKMIDEAGNIAALNAKIKKIDTEIQEANQLKLSLTSTVSIERFVDPEIVADLLDDLEANIQELQDKKKELETESKKQAKSEAKPKKEEAPKEEKE